MQMYSTISEGNSARTEKEMTVYQFKGKLTVLRLLILKNFRSSSHHLKRMK